MRENVKFNLTDIAFSPDPLEFLPSYPIIPIAGQLARQAESLME